MPNSNIERNFYVWRSDERTVSAVSARSEEEAGHAYALERMVPYNVALRVVAVDDVHSLGFRLTVCKP